MYSMRENPSFNLGSLHCPFDHLDTYGPATDLDQDGDAQMEGEADGADKEYDVLIRCTDGLEINFATRVSTSLTILCCPVELS